MNNLRLKIINRVKNQKKLIENFSYLSALHLFNLIIPLIIYPYIIRVLGKETYGLVVFAQAIVSYLVLLVGYGFNITGAMEVSVHREDNLKLTEILSSIFIIKIVFLLISFLFLYLILFFIPVSKGYESLFYMSMWFCLYDIIFPGWYFQGIEQMKWITYISLIMRLSFVGLIFVFIKKQSDFLLVPILNGVGSIIAGSVALFIIYKKHKIKFKFQSFKTLKYYFQNASPIFLSNISSSAITSTTKVIVGIYLGMAETAYFDLADKITNILKTPQFIFSQIVLPKITREKNISYVKKLRNYSIFLNIIIIGLVYIFINNIIFILGGKQMIPARDTVMIILLTVPFSALMSVYGVQMLIPFGFSKLYTKIIFASGLIYILQLAMLKYSFGITLISLSIVTLITEISTSAIAAHYCKKRIFNNLLYK